ncbi:Uncharacterised protein [Bordetella pertussis]|nr:Uncharacterised protein [Bordetella pertussis]
MRASASGVSVTASVLPPASISAMTPARVRKAATRSRTACSALPASALSTVLEAWSKLPVSPLPAW